MMKMRLLIWIGLLLPALGMGQSVAELEQQLDNASNNVQRMNLHFQLAEKLLGQDYDRAARHSFEAYDLATQLQKMDMMVRASFLDGEIALKRADYTRAEKRFANCARLSERAGEYNLAFRCFDKLEELALRKNNYNKAYQYSELAVTMAQKALKGERGDASGISALELGTLVQEKQRLEREIVQLAKDKEELLADRDVLELIQQELQQEQEQVKQAFDSLAQKKKEAERTSYLRKRRLSKVLEDKIQDSVSLNRIIAEQAEEITKRDLRLERDKYLRYLLITLSILIFAIAFLFYSRYRSKRKANKDLEEKNLIIDKERQKSNELLLNILPAAIADELKRQGKAKAQKYDQATVLFTDFRDFTRISSNMSPEELVDELDKCFKAFDYIIAQYKIEKIKTIGDAYMCACGLSDKTATPADMVRAALDMQEYLEDIKQARLAEGRPHFDARIGIHTGPVVAGVVGINKFAYDIWGDTVNIASQIEAKSHPGKVNISETTYKLVKDGFQCTPRGQIAVKGGAVKMYFVEPRT